MHPLAQVKGADPVGDSLCHLLQTNTAPAEALVQLNGRLSGGDGACALRVADEANLPPAAALPTLLASLELRITTLWADARDVNDDLRIAALGMFVVTQLRPFRQMHERLVFSFGQYLLMLRWGLDVPPLLITDEARRELNQRLSQLEADGGAYPITRALWLAGALDHLSIEVLRDDPFLGAFAELLGGILPEPLCTIAGEIDDQGH